MILSLSCDLRGNPLAVVLDEAALPPGFMRDNIYVGNDYSMSHDGREFVRRIVAVEFGVDSFTGRKSVTLVFGDSPEQDG